MRKPPNSCILWKDLTLLHSACCSSEIKQTTKWPLEDKIPLLLNYQGYLSNLSPNIPSTSQGSYYFSLYTYCALMTHNHFIISRKLDFKHLEGNGLRTVSKWWKYTTEPLWFLWGSKTSDFSWQAMRLLWFLGQYLHRDHPVLNQNIHCLFRLNVSSITGYYWSLHWWW